MQLTWCTLSKVLLPLLWLNCKLCHRMPLELCEQLITLFSVKENEFEARHAKNHREMSLTRPKKSLLSALKSLSDINSFPCSCCVWVMENFIHINDGSGWELKEMTYKFRVPLDAQCYGQIDWWMWWKSMCLLFSLTSACNKLHGISMRKVIFFLPMASSILFSLYFAHVFLFLFLWHH